MLNYTDLIGIPFVNGGRDIKTGLDCYGLVIEVYKRFGIRLPEFYADYDDCNKISNIIKEQEGNGSWFPISRELLEVPTVIALRFGVPKGIVNHTGVYIGEGQFIHTRANMGVCVDSINSPAWRLQMEGFYKYIGGRK